MAPQVGAGAVPRCIGARVLHIALPKSRDCLEIDDASDLLPSLRHDGGEIVHPFERSVSASERSAQPTSEAEQASVVLFHGGEAAETAPSGIADYAAVKAQLIAVAKELLGGDAEKVVKKLQAELLDTREQLTTISENN